jgi:hypothetical protein
MLAEQVILAQRVVLEEQEALVALLQQITFQ